MSELKTPFRFDCVGSFLRPKQLKQDRSDFTEGRISQSRLKEVENEAARELVGRQKALG